MISVILPLWVYLCWFGHFVAVPLLEKRNNYERERTAGERVVVPTVAAFTLCSKRISGEAWRGVFHPQTASEWARANLQRWLRLVIRYR